MREREIRSWIYSLRASYGRPRPNIDTTELQHRHRKKDYSGMALTVARSLKLDMRLRVGLVNKGGRQKAAAWIDVPAVLPMYGSSDFKAWMTTVYIRREFLSEAPFESVAYVLAHEFSHVILAATRHPLRNKEEVVDLTAMYFGYKDISVQGGVFIEKMLPDNWEYMTPVDFVECVSRRADQIEIHTLGYLNDEERVFAADLLASL